MRPIIYYVASSLDSYIARKDGSVDWLSIEGNEDDYGYADFFDSVDTTIMGNTTYKQVLTFGEFPYKGKDYFVFTRSGEEEADQHVQFVRGDYGAFIRELKSVPGKDIWLIGGTRLADFFLENGWIDHLILSVIPVILGDGIPLFNSPAPETKMELLSSKTFDSGLVQLHYRRADTDG